MRSRCKKFVCVRDHCCIQQVVCGMDGDRAVIVIWDLQSVR